MGKLTLGKVVRTVGKISREIERERKRQERELRKQAKEFEREQRARYREAEKLEKQKAREEARALKEKERERLKREKEKQKEEARLAKEKEKQRKLKEKEAEKSRKEALKVKEKESKEAKKLLTALTIKEHGLGKGFSNHFKAPDLKFDLSAELLLLQSEGISLSRKKIKPSYLDNILLSGRFNSVYGMDGLRDFKNSLTDLIKDFDDESFVFDEPYVEELIFATGIYYEYEFASEAVRRMEDSTSWKSFYRLVRNLTDYKVLSEISLDYLKSEHPKHFSEYTENDVEALKEAVSVLAPQIKHDLEEYLNRVIKNQLIA